MNVDTNNSFHIVNFFSPVKKVFFYMLVFVVCAIVISLLVTVKMAPTFSKETRDIFYVTIFLLIGFTHLFSSSKWLPQTYKAAAKTGFAYSIILTVFLGIAIFLFFIFARFDNPLLALAAACGFLLPTALLQSWNYFDSISPYEHNPWFLPTNLPPEKNLAILLNSIPVTIKIKTNYFDIEEKSFPMSFPGNLQMGIMFHRFLTHAASAGAKFELLDQHQKPYAWKFLLQRRLGNKVLNPEETLADNKIKQNDTIIIERIKTDQV